MIKLEKESDGTTKAFRINIAEKILRDRETVFAKVKNYWKLPEDSKFTFKDGSLIKKKKENDS